MPRAAPVCPAGVPAVIPTAPELNGAGMTNVSNHLMTIVTTTVLCLALLLPDAASTEFRRAAGADHFLLLKADGTVWGFGECAQGMGPLSFQSWFAC